MSNENALKIGLAIQGIATLVDNETLEKIRSRLNTIEAVCLEEVKREEERQKCSTQ